MSSHAPAQVRAATPDDADAIGRLLYDFNTEFEEPAPDPPAIADRMRELMTGDDFVVLLVGDGPDGLAVLRFRPSIWSSALECYLAELYVVPALRGHAIAFARDHGADYMDLGTGETDTAARALYESLGFSNRKGKPDGPLNFYYERELR
jgi:ribosomal protein S18 acetylase RimI-like enzyme